MHPLAQRVLAVAFVGFLVGCATSSSVPQQATPSNIEAVTPAVADSTDDGSKLDPDRIVCRRMVVTGTRIASSVCKPASEWQLLTRKSGETLDEVQRDAAVQIPNKN